MAKIRPARTRPQPLPQAPRALGAPGLSLWNRVISGDRIEDCGGLEILAQACQALDRAETLRSEIERDGDVLRLQGTVRDHPALETRVGQQSFYRSHFGEARIEFRAREGGCGPSGLWRHWLAIMSTKRIPIHRPIRAQIPPDALDLFREMKNVKCTFPPIDWKGRYWERHECPGCERLWSLHSRLAAPIEWSGGDVSLGMGAVPA